MLNEYTQPPFLTVAEVAHYLRVSETTAWRWCTSGKLPAFRIGRSWRVRRGDLETLTHSTDVVVSRSSALVATTTIVLHTALEDA